MKSVTLFGKNSIRKVFGLNCPSLAARWDFSGIYRNLTTRLIRVCQETLRPDRHLFTVSGKGKKMTLKMNAGTPSAESIKKLRELSGVNIKLCMQCATCTGMCPMAAEMDFTPRKVMHLAQFGLRDKLADINSYWKCASCHACTVKCPRGIDIAKVMEALRQQTLRTGRNYIEPSRMSAETIAELPQIALVAGLRKLTC